MTEEESGRELRGEAADGAAPLKTISVVFNNVGEPNPLAVRAVL